MTNPISKKFKILYETNTQVLHVAKKGCPLRISMKLKIKYQQASFE